jgi:riboflavin kinase/FMN adenylyltransferase
VKAYKELAELDASGRVVTIGKFDGIHLGHQALIKAAVETADRLGLLSTVVTFDRNPSAVLAGESERQDLVGPNQKTKLIEQLGCSEMLELCFDEELSKETATTFIQRVLVDSLNTNHLVVGKDFRFGHQGAGNVELLQAVGARSGFQVTVIEPVMQGGSAVSSTRIRNLLNAGDVHEAAKLLGRNHATTGLVEHGLKIGRQLGFPTANLSRSSEGYLPKDAVYAGWLIDGQNRYPAALSVGVNETIQAVPRLIEAHVLDRKDLDLYDREVTVEYVDFIRDSAKFASVEELIEAINRDLEAIRMRLDSANPQQTHR